eukprot:scaffold299489_cov33-Tisochrysis_lutea.AAC.2
MKLFDLAQPDSLERVLLGARAGRPRPWHAWTPQPSRVAGGTQLLREPKDVVFPGKQAPGQGREEHGVRPGCTWMSHSLRR